VVLLLYSDKQHWGPWQRLNQEGIIASSFSGNEGTLFLAIQYLR